MPIGRSLIFFSTNNAKISAARQCLQPHGIEVNAREDALHEIQADDVELISRYKAAQAYARAGQPVIVEDSGLFIEALNGFPGPYLKAVMTTVGPPALLQLLEGHENRSCKLISALVLQWSFTETVAFTSVGAWCVRTSPATAVPGGWSDLWTLLEADPQAGVSGEAEAPQWYPQVFVQLGEWIRDRSRAGKQEGRQDLPI